MTITVLYFAMLREQRGLDSEALQVTSPDLKALYETLAAQHGFLLASDRIRPAVNDEFCEWQQTLQDGDVVAFVPPVAGG